LEERASIIDAQMITLPCSEVHRISHTYCPGLMLIEHELASRVGRISDFKRG
jgi:hypothetical protein